MTSGVGSLEELSNIITGAPFEINGNGFGTGITAASSGVVLRRNLCPNPSFETNTTGWSVSGTGATISRVTSGALVGTARLQVSQSGTGSTAFVKLTVSSLSIGASYTLSGYGSISGLVGVSAGVTGIGDSSSLTSPSGTQWMRPSFTFTATATSHEMVFKFTRPSAAAFTVFLDAVLLENRIDLDLYFDGDTTDTDAAIYAWTGTANASISTKTGAFVELVNIDGASESDQIELTRDSQPGAIVFEDPDGTIQIFDPDNYRTGASAQTLTPSNYSAIDMQFDMSHIINVLTITFVEKIKSGGKTRKVALETTFVDSASVAKYGKFKKSVTTHKKSVFSSDYADKVFAKNADPDNVPQSVTVTICANGKQVAALPFGYADGTYVGNKIDVEDPNGVTYTCRVSRIEHAVTPDTWQMKIFLRNQSVIQRPRSGETDRSLETFVANNPDGMVLSSHIEDDIDGTGKTISSATWVNDVSVGPGFAGIAIEDDTSGGVIKFYSGLGGESAGYVNPSLVAGTNPAVKISSGSAPGSTVPASLELSSNLTDGTCVVDAALVGLHDAQFTGDLHVSGPAGILSDTDVEVTGQLRVNKVSGNIVTIPHLDANTGGTANVNWNSANGNLRLISSARRFKSDETPLEIDVEAALRLVPKVYTRLATDEDDAHREVGFIAEDAEELGLTPWVVYDRDGEVFSFDYFKWGVALQAICRSQQRRLDEQDGRIAQLEANVRSLLSQSPRT